jgi:hypothetical protein
MIDEEAALGYRDAFTPEAAAVLEMSDRPPMRIFSARAVIFRQVFDRAPDEESGVAKLQRLLGGVDGASSTFLVQVGFQGE